MAPQRWLPQSQKGTKVHKGNFTSGHSRYHLGYNTSLLQNGTTKKLRRKDKGLGHKVGKALRFTKETSLQGIPGINSDTIPACFKMVPQSLKGTKRHKGLGPQRQEVALRVSAAKGLRSTKEHLAWIGNAG
jgi:hypothetical protein